MVTDHMYGALRVSWGPCTLAAEQWSLTLAAQNHWVGRFFENADASGPPPEVLIQLVQAGGLGTSTPTDADSQPTPSPHPVLYNDSTLEFSVNR